MKNIIMAFLIICISWTSNAQVVFTKSYSADNIEHFIVSNIDGDMEVSTSTSGKIEVTVSSTSGPLDPSISIAEKSGNGYAALYLKMPNNCDENENEFNPTKPLRLLSHSGDCNWNHTETPPTLKFKIKVPTSIKVYVSTINNGDVVVTDWAGQVWANNINGSIKLERVADVSHAKTINGPVDVEYTQAPKSPAVFGTINGDIRIKVPGPIKATTSFKTFSGEFYTDQENIKVLPTAKITKNDKNGFKYKVENTRGIEIGGGGVQLDFDTFNGSAYLTSY